jgi:hypothetical protein
LAVTDPLSVSGTRAAGAASRIIGAPDPHDAKGLLRDRATLALVALSFVLQLAYIVFANAPTDIGDQIVYREIGEHFKSYWHNGYFGPDLRTPGYGAFLASFYELGFGDWAIKLTQALILSATCGLVAHMAARKGGVVAGRIAAGLFCCYLPLISFSSMLLEEALAVGLVTAGVAACVLMNDGRLPTRAAWLAGTLLIVALIVRPNTLTVMAPAVLFLVLSAYRRSAAIRTVVAIAVVFAVVFGPWIGRNFALFSKPLVLGDAGSASLAQGLHLPIDKEVGQFGSYRRAQHFFGNQRDFGQADVPQFDASRELHRDLTDHLGEFLLSRLYFQYEMWVWPITARTQYGSTDVIPYAAIQLLHLMILLAGLAGLVLTWRYASSRLFAAITVCTALPYLLYYPSPRYTLTAMPFLIVGASIAIRSVGSRLAIRRWRSRTEPSTATAAELRSARAGSA